MSKINQESLFFYVVQDSKDKKAPREILRISSAEVFNYIHFFRAKSVKDILQKCKIKKVSKNHLENILLDELRKNKKYLFEANNIIFSGKAIRKINLAKNKKHEDFFKNDDCFLEIEILPGRLYFYSLVSKYIYYEVHALKKLSFFKKIFYSLF